MIDIRNKVKLPCTDLKHPANLVTFSTQGKGIDHFAIIFNENSIKKVCNVRIHSECITGDVFGSLRCDCGPQLHSTMKLFDLEGGVICYLRQEGRGIGLSEKIAAYALQEKGLDTYQANAELGHPADSRDYSLAIKMLNALNIVDIQLHTNNPLKAASLAESSIIVNNVIPTETFISPHNRKYLEAKSNAGHTISVKP